MESDTATELGGRTCGGSSPDDLQVEAARRQIEEQTAEALRIDPGYAKRSLADLSREAAALQKQAMYTNSIAAYNKLFLKAKVQRTTHKELFVCYGNRASAYLKLGSN